MNRDEARGMPRRLGPGLLLAALLGGVALAPVASAQVTSRYDGEYVGELTLTALIQGDCTTPPLGALYPLTISGGQVRFAYLPRFATTLTGSVAEDGSFRATAPTRHGVVEMTGQIRGNAVRAQIASPSCRYNFATKD
jgi:hypothetical protein